MQTLILALAAIAGLAGLFFFVLWRIKTEPKRMEEKRIREMIQNTLDFVIIAGWRSKFDSKYHAYLDWAAKRAFDKDYVMIEFADVESMVALHEKIKNYPGLKECKEKIVDEIRNTIEFRLSKIEAKEVVTPGKIAPDEAKELASLKRGAVSIENEGLIKRIEEMVRKAGFLKDESSGGIKEVIAQKLEATV